MSSYVDRQLNGSKNVPKSAKMAVVIYIYTWENRDVSMIPDHMIAISRRTTKQMIERLISELEKDDFVNHYGETPRSESLMRLLAASKKTTYHNVWMTLANQWMHTIIHDHCQAYDPADRDSNWAPDFFKTIFEEITGKKLGANQ